MWLLGATLISLACDFAARSKVGGTHLNFFIAQQIPVLSLDSFQASCMWRTKEDIKDWLRLRVLELIYTSDNLRYFARDCNYFGPAFLWEDDRRFHIRCELDAAFFHLYGIERDDVDYIMETFPIVKKKDIARTEVKDDQGNVTTEGTYITKDTILEIYDAMQQAIDSGQPYQTRLDPPPGPPTNPDGTFADLPQWKPGEPRPADWPSHIHPPREVMEHQRKEQA
jgi:hypothetical protein